MAVLIPETPKDCTRSERLVFQRLGAELDKEWVVLHSLGLANHPDKRRGEADVVVVGTKGVFVLEVKGGQVSCRDGVWHYGVPGGREFLRREDPWSQASQNMFAVIDQVKKCAPAQGDVLFGYGVVMPAERFTATGIELDPALLLDKRDFPRNLGFYIGALERRWRQIYVDRHGRAPRSPTLDDVKKIRAVLRPDIESTFSLGSWLTGLEQEQIQLTNDQIRVSRRLAANPRMVVTGKAGTGKTVLAIHRARDLAWRGLHVLFLCFNQLLARHVTETLAGDAFSGSITVRHLHAHYRDTIVDAGLQNQLPTSDGDSDHLFNILYPQLYVDALLRTEPKPFDAVVVDEAQDLLTLDHLDALDLTVEGGLDEGRWHLFFDPQQNIFSTQQDSVEARLKRVSYARDELTDNCRNTKQIAYQTSIISNLDVAVEGAPPGPECACVYYRRPEDGVAQIEATIERLLAQDVRPESIIVLSTRKRENSLIGGITHLAGLEVRDVASKASGKSIAFSTMHAFKGLERSVVLAIDLVEVGQQEWSMLHYAGLSRARTLVVPFLPIAREPRYLELATEFGRRIARA